MSQNAGKNIENKTMQHEIFGYKKWGDTVRKPVVEHENNEIQKYYKVPN